MLELNRVIYKVDQIRPEHLIDGLPVERFDNGDGLECYNKIGWMPSITIVIVSLTESQISLYRPSLPIFPVS
jgi:hypothetical protein